MNLTFEKCKIYFYYGLESIEDYQELLSVLRYFTVRSIGPIYPNSSCKNLRQTLNLICNHSRSLSISNYNEYKNILEEANIFNASRYFDDISKKYLNEFELIDTARLKKQAKLLIFFVHKQYVESELFEKHWKEAIELNKEILILDIERSSTSADLQQKFEKQKYFMLTREMLNHSSNENEIDKFINNYLPKNSEVSLI